MPLFLCLGEGAVNNSGFFDGFRIRCDYGFVNILSAGGEMTEETKPKAERGTKLVRCPESLHARILELQGLMAERGHQGYWLNKAGNIVHGPIENGPLHLVIAWAVGEMADAMTPGLEERSELRMKAYEAGADYVASFQEKLRKPEKIKPPKKVKQ